MAEQEVHVAAPPALTPSDAAVGRTRRARQLLGRVPEWAVLVVVLGALVAFFSARSPYFFQTDNFINILIASAVVGIIACPTTMLLVAGQFDLSVGAGVALVTCMFATSFVGGDGSFAAVLIALAVGIGIGALNGFLVTVVGVNALITTIGTMGAMRAFAYIRTDGQAIGFNGFTTLGIDRPFLNIPWMVWIFVFIVLITAFVMKQTTYGRALYAIGANSTAARLAGIRTRYVIFVGFVISGLAVQAVTAVILGGASLAGGRGSIVGTILGVLVIGVINNGLVLLNVVSFWQDVVRNLLLIAAVAIDQLRLRIARE